MQLMTSLGLTPNTAIIGAVIAMLIGRILIPAFSMFKSIHRQNLMQTSISSATFGAANSLLIPIGIPFVMGKPELIVPMLIGLWSLHVGFWGRFYRQNLGINPVWKRSLTEAVFDTVVCR